MGTFIITLFVLSLAAYIFVQVWRLMLRFFFYILEKAVDVVKKIIVAVKRLGRVVFLMYKRHKNGRIFKVEFKEEEVNEEDVPEGLRDELKYHDEVKVKEGDIDPSEF